MTGAVAGPSFWSFRGRGLASDLVAGKTPGPRVYLVEAKASDKIDPTRTSRLRRDFEAEFNRRFRRLMKAIAREVATLNGFGITAPKTAARFKFTTDQARIAGFQSWMEDAVNRFLFDGALGESFDKAAKMFWGNSFANIAYRRGLLSATGAFRRAGGRVSAEYVASALSRGQHAETLRTLYSRMFEDLKGITQKMSSQIGRALAEGLAGAKGPFEIAKMINDRVEKIGMARARLIARTEIISAYNEAELNAFEDAGLAGVTLSPEWLTAGDDRVCPLCEEAARRSYTISEARGFLPLHPNCRCAWAPVIEDGKGIELK